MRLLLLFLFIITSTPALANEPATGAFLGAKQTEHPEWFYDSFLDLPEDVAELASQNKRLVIYFYQNGCPYCAKLVEDNFGNEEFQGYFRSRFELLDLNMWGDRSVTGLDGVSYSEKSYAAKLKVQFTPTLLFLDRKGKVAYRLNGYRSIEQMRKIISYLDEHPSGDVSMADWLAGKQSTSGAMIHEPYFMKPPYILDRRIPSQRPLVVLFEKPDCDECEQYHKNALAHPEVKKRLEACDVVQLDISGNDMVVTTDGRKMTASEWAAELNVTYTPAMLIFNEEGQAVIRKDAMLKHFHTWGILEYALSGAYKEQPSFQRFLEHYADELRAKGLDVNIWE